MPSSKATILTPLRWGIALAAVSAVSAVIMPFLSWAQRRTGRALGSHAVVAVLTQALLCTYLSVVLLVGLVLNATLGWAWANPLAALVIAVVAVREGIEAWRGEGCACGPAPSGSVFQFRACLRGRLLRGPGSPRNQPGELSHFPP